MKNYELALKKKSAASPLVLLIQGFQTHFFRTVLFFCFKKIRPDCHPPFRLHKLFIGCTTKKRGGGASLGQSTRQLQWRWSTRRARRRSPVSPQKLQLELQALNTQLRVFPSLADQQGLTTGVC